MRLLTTGLTSIIWTCPIFCVLFDIILVSMPTALHSDVFVYSDDINPQVSRAPSAGHEKHSLWTGSDHSIDQSWLQSPLRTQVWSRRPSQDIAHICTTFFTMKSFVLISWKGQPNHFMFSRVKWEHCKVHRHIKLIMSLYSAAKRWGDGWSSTPVTALYSSRIIFI